MDNELRQLIVEGDELGVERYLELRDERTFDRGISEGQASAWYSFEPGNPHRIARLAKDENR